MNFGSLLNTLLSDAQTPSANQTQGGVNIVSDLMTTLSGSQALPTGAHLQVNGAGPIGDLINSALATSGGQGTANALIQSVVDGVANKAGVDPTTAQQVVTFALGALAHGKSGNATYDHNDLVNKIKSGKGLSATYLHSTGLTKQLADKTGMDPQTAAATLEHALKALGAQAK